MTNFYLHDERTVKGLRKIAWASVFHFSFAMSPCPCPCLQVSSKSPPCLHFSMFPCLMSMSQCFNVSFSMSSCRYVFMFPCLQVNICAFPEFRKWKTATLFAVNGKWKRQTSVYLLLVETKN